MECKHCGSEENYCLKKVPIFANLTHEEMYELSKTIVQRQYKKGEILYLEGEKAENLYIINEGMVKIYKVSESGKEQIIRLLSVGDFIGEVSIFTNSISTNTAETTKNTKICVLNVKDLKRIINEKPSISIKIIQELGSRLEKTEELIEAIKLMSVEKRLAKVLLDMAEGNNTIHLYMSKKDLASHIGISQETLSRKLTSFQNNGWIDQQGQRNIFIKDKDALENIQ